MTEPSAGATCREVHVRYPSGDSGLRGLSCTIPAGGRFAVCGTSGSGKTTLLRVLGGLLRPTSGSVEVAGVDLGSLDDVELAEYRRTAVGTVFQHGHLLPELDGRDNVALGLRLGGVRRAPARRRADELLERLGMADLGARMPAQLSGGQRQRLAVARAVAPEPRLVLADEPTGSLDRTNAQAVLTLLVESAEAVGGTLVVVTHDDEVAAVCDRVLRVEDGRAVDRVPS